MSVFNTIYDALQNAPNVTGLLAESEYNPTKPAIYEEWASEYTQFPYMVYTISHSEGDHWAKQDSVLNLDIFTEGDTVTAEKIKNECIKVIDRQIFKDQETGANVRIYYSRDGIITEPTPKITHWNLEFSLRHWRKDFISHLNS
jgi:hypothetical protein